jgi:hypothetical protein
MKPAVREEKALLSLLRKAAVPALAMALATFVLALVVAGLTAQTPSTQPSRSVTAITALVASGLPGRAAARVTACATMVRTSARVSWAEARNASSQKHSVAIGSCFTTWAL